MYIDAELQYSDSQALTATAVSTNVLDHKQDRNLGQGNPFVVQVTLDTVADDADADETYTVTLQTDDNEAFASPAQVGGVLIIPAGSPAGSKFYIAIPPDKAFERYSRLNFTLGGTTPSVTVKAMLTPMNFVDNAPVAYDDAITISG